VFFKDASDQGFKDAGPFAMDDPQLINFFFETFLNIVIKLVLYLPGLKSMEIKDTINRDFYDRTSGHYFNLGT